MDVRHQARCLTSIWFSIQTTTGGCGVWNCCRNYLLQRCGSAYVSLRCDPRTYKDRSEYLLGSTVVAHVLGLLGELPEALV